MNDAKTPKTPDFNLDEFTIPPPIFTDCQACGHQCISLETNEKNLKEDHEPFCVSCRRKYPASLLKATIDPFDYALRLRTGELWYFTEAEIHGEYVHLDFANHPQGDENPMPCLFDRGVDVRARDIVWCADAPNGS